MKWEEKCIEDRGEDRFLNSFKNPIKALITTTHQVVREDIYLTQSTHHAIYFYLTITQSTHHAIYFYLTINKPINYLTQPHNLYLTRERGIYYLT